MTTLIVLSESEAMDIFDQMLDDCNPDYEIGFLRFSASAVLKTMDPIAYREDFMLYVQTMGDDGAFLVEGYTDE